MKKIIYLSACVILLITACKKDKATPDAPATTTTTSGKVTFNADIKPIMLAKCATAGCHAASSQFPDLTTYSSTKSSIGSIINRMGLSSTNGSFMPQGGAKVQSDVDKVTKWNTDGLLEQ